jgi:hypothetical protein
MNIRKNVTAAAIGSLLFWAPSVIPIRAGSGVPDTTGAFVTFCKLKANQDECVETIVLAQVLISVNTKMAVMYNYCPPMDLAGNGYYLAPSILKWLGDHAELRSVPTQKAIGQAWGARYPCNKK